VRQIPSTSAQVSVAKWNVFNICEKQMILLLVSATDECGAVGAGAGGGEGLSLVNSSELR
jgi:hypothetical protein